MATKLKLLFLSLRRLSSRTRAKLARQLASLARRATRLLAASGTGVLGQWLGRVAVACALAAITVAGLSGGLVRALDSVHEISGFDRSNPAVAMDAEGNYVIVWDSDGQEGSTLGTAVYARRFSKDGRPLSAEFRVNTYQTNDQMIPAVAMDADGDFVVAWQSFGQDGSNWGIFAQRFDANGLAVGSEFQVNTFTNSYQLGAEVAMAPDGDFIVGWQSFNQDGSDWGSYFRRYNADGTPAGGEQRANVTTAGDQSVTKIGMDRAGNFAVAWHSGSGQDGSGFGVFARTFAADGTPTSGEIAVNQTTALNQWFPDLAMDADGDFVVAWTGHYNSSFSSSPQDNIFARRFDATGTPQGNEFSVSPPTGGYEYHYDVSVSMDDDGDFVLAWNYSSSSLFSASALEVLAAGYRADGTALFSGAIAADSYAGEAAVGMDNDGDYVIVFSQYDYDAYNTYDIVQEQDNLFPVSDNGVGPMVGGVSIGGSWHRI